MRNPYFQPALLKMILLSIFSNKAFIMNKLSSIKTTIYIVIAVLWVGCETTIPAKEKASFDARATSLEAKATLEQYYLSIQEKGLSAEFDFLDTSSQFTWIPPGYREPLSFDSVRHLIEENAAMGTSIANTWDTLIVNALSPEIACYSGRFKSTVIDSTGFELVLTFTETGILVKRPDGWKLLQGQTALVRGE